MPFDPYKDAMNININDLDEYGNDIKKEQKEFEKQENIKKDANDQIDSEVAGKLGFVRKLLYAEIFDDAKALLEEAEQMEKNRASSKGFCDNPEVYWCKVLLTYEARDEADLIAKQPDLEHDKYYKLAVTCCKTEEQRQAYQFVLDKINAAKKQQAEAARQAAEQPREEKSKPAKSSGDFDDAFKKKLRRVSHMIDAGDFDEARERLDKIEQDEEDRTGDCEIPQVYHYKMLLDYKARTDEELIAALIKKQEDITQNKNYRYAKNYAEDIEDDDEFDALLAIKKKSTDGIAKAKAEAEVARQAEAERKRKEEEERRKREEEERKRQAEAEAKAKAEAEARARAEAERRRREEEERRQREEAERKRKAEAEARARAEAERRRREEEERKKREEEERKRKAEAEAKAKAEAERKHKEEEERKKREEAERKRKAEAERKRKEEEERRKREEEERKRRAEENRKALSTLWDYKDLGNGYINFGAYPQSKKAGNIQLLCMYDKARGYYLGSDNCLYEECDGEYYKVEPIKWIVLSQGSECFIVSDMIIDRQIFHGSSNNYANSDIRSWLNNDFYNKAFKDSQQSKIVTTNVDNSVSSTGDSSNEFVCGNTSDKVFLLSHKEAQQYFGSNESRKCVPTEYAVARGAYQYTDNYSKYKLNGKGCGWWWLRSPCWNYSNSAQSIDRVGDFNSYYVYINFGGVRCALKFKP